jgi:hypothetical protein
MKGAAFQACYARKARVRSIHTGAAAVPTALSEGQQTAPCGVAGRPTGPAMEFPHRALPYRRGSEPGSTMQGTRSMTGLRHAVQKMRQGGVLFRPKRRKAVLCLCEMRVPARADRAGTGGGARSALSSRHCRRAPAARPRLPPEPASRWTIRARRGRSRSKLGEGSAPPGLPSADSHPKFAMTCRATV